MSEGDGIEAITWADYGPGGFSRLWTAPEPGLASDSAISIHVTMSDGTRRTAARIDADGRVTIDWEAVEQGAQIADRGSELVVGVCRLLLAVRANPMTTVLNGERVSIPKLRARAVAQDGDMASDPSIHDDASRARLCDVREKESSPAVPISQVKYFDPHPGIRAQAARFLTAPQTAPDMEMSE